jgi:hypothetical protein
MWECEERLEVALPEEVNLTHLPSVHVSLTLDPHVSLSLSIG